MTNKKLYTVERAEKKTPFPEGITKAAKETLKKAAVEDNTIISKNTSSPTNYTLVIIDATTKNKSQKINSIEENIESINTTLGTKITKISDDTPYVGVLENQALFRPTYSLSKEDAQKLFEHGVPKITYGAESARPPIQRKRDNNDFRSNKNICIAGNRPLGGIREAALKEAAKGSSIELP